MGRLLAGFALALLCLLIWVLLAEEAPRGGAHLVSAVEPATTELAVLAAVVADEPAVERSAVLAQETAGAASADTCEVIVSVTTGYREELRPCPGIQVAVGLGATEHAPRWRDQPVLARGVSDQAGRIALRIPLPRERTRSQALIFARVESPGYRQRTASVYLSRVLPDKPLELRAIEGDTLYGMVQDESQDPVASAEVTLFAEESLRYAGAAKTDALGRFALDHRHSTNMLLHARAGGVGSGTVALGPLEDSPPEGATVVLRGAGVLAGRILDPGGNPVRGLRVTATSAGEPRPSQAQILKREQAGGISRDVTTTDADGNFRFDVGAWLVLPGGPTRPALFPGPDSSGHRAEGGSR